MSRNENPKPIIAVFSRPDENPWPGLDCLNPNAEVRQTDNLESLREAIADASILVVTDFNADLLRNVWSEATVLQWVHGTSTGVNALLFPELLESNIPLTHAPGIFDEAIAEYVLGLMLVYVKDFHRTLAYQRDRKWRHRDTDRLSDQRLLVVGAGSIGRAIGSQARAAGMEVDGIARSAREGDDIFSNIYGSDELIERLSDADFVVIAAPLTDETRGLMGDKAFAAMKANARLINIGRGEIVQTDALMRALRGGQIAGAALDVFEQEPLPPDHPIWEFPEVIVSPHMSGDFRGWREALSRQFIENFERWRRGEPLQCLVDKESGYAKR